MSSIKLTQAEEDLIEANRASEQIAKDQKSAEQAVRDERAKKEQANRLAKLKLMVDALNAADENNITFQTEEGGETNAFFLLDGQQKPINISDHRVTTGRGWSSHSTGIKYQLCGGYNNYSNRYYTNPKTVIKKITELQEAVTIKNAREKFNSNLNEQAVAILSRKYPKANVVFEKGYDYRTNRTNRNSYQPSYIRVTTLNGSVDFTYQKDDKEEIVFTIRARHPSKDINSKITTLILE